MLYSLHVAGVQLSGEEWQGVLARLTSIGHVC